MAQDFCHPNHMYKTELKNFSIEDIASSGQCFRLVPGTKKAEFKLIAYGRVLNISHVGSDYSFSCSKSEFDTIWQRYFDLECDYEIYKNMIIPGDLFLREAIRFGGGIRILNQEPWEVLISFIISQRKSVPAIRTSVERLCKAFGESIDDQSYAFPTAKALDQADEKALSSCGLGYRLPYVKKAALAVVNGDLDLEKASKSKTAKLIETFMKLKGVGIKVASCVALFGFHRLDVLPVDVWMRRVIDTQYGGSFPKEYLKYAGVLQQYMYNYARLNKINGKITLSS